MNRAILFVLFIFCSMANAWECEDTNNSNDIEVHWNKKAEVFVARVMEGKYLPENKYKSRFSYAVSVKHTLKGKAQGSLRLVGDDLSPRLEMGENYIFFLYGSDLNLCSLVLPFEFSWVERKDTVEQAAYVKKVLELSGYKP